MEIPRFLKIGVFRNESLRKPRVSTTDVILEEELQNIDPERWASNVFLRGSIDPRTNRPVTNRSLGRLAALIVGSAQRIDHEIEPAIWFDEGSGYGAVGNDQMRFVFKDGSEGFLRWNAALMQDFPKKPVIAQGRIREMILKDFRRAQVDGPIPDGAQLFYGFPETYGSSTKK